MIPYGRQSIDAADIAAVKRVLRSDFLTQGPHIPKFEKAIARKIGARYAVTVSNGTAALHCAYLAAGIGKGDDVITTPNTFVATTNMLLILGAKPVFCDIRPDTYNIDETKIEKLITKKTKAIVPVHFAGHPCEMDAIRRIAKKHSLLVIEDAAHGLGARYKKKKIGALGDMTTFSFHPVKPITTGEGGAITTNSKVLYEKMLLARNHGTYKDKKGINVMTVFGFNYRLSDIHSALGISQLKKLDQFNKKRHLVVSWYAKALKDIPEIIMPQELSNVYSSWHLYVIRVKNPNDRNPLIAFLKKNGIGVNFHYPAVYSHPFYRSHGYKKTKLEEMERYHKTAITLPCFPGLTRKDVVCIAQAIRHFYSV